MRSAKMESKNLAKDIRSVTGLSTVVCSMVAKAAVAGSLAGLRYDNPSTTEAAVLAAVIGNVVVGPRGQYLVA